jgi:site-specific DNA-methyltransferase (adenine-specific)
MNNEIVTIGNINLIHGDCLPLLREYPDNTFDLAIVDPPFGSVKVALDKNGKRIFKPKERKNSHIGQNTFRKYAKRKHKYGDQWQEWNNAPPPEYFDQLFRISKEQIIFGGNFFPLPITRNFIVWDKMNISENFNMAMCELAWCSMQGNAKIARFPSQGYCYRINRFHPCQKPVALYLWILKHYAKDGMKIIDTHSGSGSLEVASIRTHLNYKITAIEIDDFYFNKAAEWIKKEYENSQNVFSELLQ